MGEARSSEWFRAALILEAMGRGRPFSFTYHSGSECGTSRRVHPVLLFTTSQDLCTPDLTAAPHHES